MNFTNFKRTIVFLLLFLSSGFLFAQKPDIKKVVDSLLINKKDFIFSSSGKLEITATSKDNKDCKIEQDSITLYKIKTVIL